MSLRPATASLYNQGLRNPSGAFFSEIKKSLSSEIMPATVCTLEISRMPGDRLDNAEWSEGREA